ncbi:MAG TPA: histidinol dehydrogenase [Candidatus Aphodomorpha intestinavium]|uniref:Histidinol dehydrogenase n=1 Tax=Candidatus Aphodomorpha intestinavium TaxID=2840672 RepID=A0A9D1STQ2_9FIRM|nr:histidinol dehydrogenase [Candidatus Aphodomorpha intestinavium]
MIIPRYTLGAIGVEEILRREAAIQTGAEEAVRRIMEDVRARGDEALLEYTERFDGVRPEPLYVTEAEFAAAEAAVARGLADALARAAARIEAFHRRQVRQDTVLLEEDGVVLGQRFTPVARAGLYVPGGTASYPSSVLMNAIPARLAGVDEIVIATPPRRDGTVAPLILLAARQSGVTRVLKAGGAQAVAALAFGTERVPRVDKITGPGNLYVATAKKLAFGQVSIDMVAGPSEILVLADGSADPAAAAADLLSQAEHDRLASAVLVTDCPALADAVEAELARQLPLLPRQDVCRASLAARGKLIVSRDLDEALDAANRIAPEHLELMVRDPFALLMRVKNAGSVFLGHHTPEAVGDYFAGPNHVLPTGGTARFSSPLSVDDFVKKTQFLYYTQDALRRARADVTALAEAEGLHAHARSVAIRFAGEEGMA